MLDCFIKSQKQTKHLICHMPTTLDQSNIERRSRYLLLFTHKIMQNTPHDTSERITESMTAQLQCGMIDSYEYDVVESFKYAPVIRMENKATKMLLRQKNFGIRSDQMLQGH